MANDWDYALEIPHHPYALRIACHTLRFVLEEHGEHELVDTAELLASELVANAHRNSAGPAHVRVKRCGTRLRVSVWDTNPTLPVLEDVPESGGGLSLIRLCADSYGGFSLGESAALGAGGKLIWFELAEGPGWRARTRRSALG